MVDNLVPTNIKMTKDNFDRMHRVLLDKDKQLVRLEAFYTKWNKRIGTLISILFMVMWTSAVVFMIFGMHYVMERLTFGLTDGFVVTDGGNVTAVWLVFISGCVVISVTGWRLAKFFYEYWNKQINVSG